MVDSIVVDGDTVMFDPTFGSAIVTPQPGTISSMATKVSIGGKLACLDGDESAVQVPGCAYINAAFVGGVGTLKIQALAPDQKTMITQLEGKPAILVGSKFIASFEVTKPAEIPPAPPVKPNPTPDPMPSYVGQGSFVTVNQTVKAA